MTTQPEQPDDEWLIEESRSLIEASRALRDRSTELIAMSHLLLASRGTIFVDPSPASA